MEFSNPSLIKLFAFLTIFLHLFFFYFSPIITKSNSQSIFYLHHFQGLCVGIGVGFLRHLHVTNDFVIDIICADFVINTTLAGIWLTAEKYASSVPKKIPDPEIFHVTSKGFYLTSGEFFIIFLQIGF